MKKEFRSFKEARKFAQTLKIRNRNDWRTYGKSGKLPDNIPRDPISVYKKEWKGWADWLRAGKKLERESKFLLFEQAREFALKLKLESISDWKKYIKSEELPEEIPRRPSWVYRNQGWIDWGDFLGTENIAPQLRKFWSFEKARDYVHKLELTSVPDFDRFAKSGKLPKEIPRLPRRTYKDQGWIDWGDFLGTGRISNQLKEYWPFEKAHNHVHKLGLTSQNDWKKYIKSGKLPEEIPHNPRGVYKDQGWTNFGDWVGTGEISVNVKSANWLSWKEAKLLYQKIAKENNLKNLNDWKQYVKTHKLPKGLPPVPKDIYRKEKVSRREKMK